MSVGLTRSRVVVIRLLALLTVTLGASYVTWRWSASVNWAVGWVAVPLVLAETATLLDTSLLGVTMWRATVRGEPPRPQRTATVDVVVTAGDEPERAALETARAAARIGYPHRTWVLDDRERPGLRRAAWAARVGYLARMPGHPSGPSGGLDRALFATDGEFLLVLAAGDVPEAGVLDRTLGYFRDPRVAVVRAPRAPADPADGGSPLFAGPVQQGRDGWGAAFCCGATAVLRREALIQLGIASCVQPAERTVRRVLRTAETVLRNAHGEARRHGPGVLAALDQVEASVDEARRDLRRDGPGAGRRASTAEITYRFRMRVTAASRGLVDADIVALHADLAELAPPGWYAAPTPPLLDSASLAWLARQEMSPLRAMASVRALVEAVDVARVAAPRTRVRTLPEPDDVATAMRLHAMGWTSIYHPEPLVRAPEHRWADRRLRWAAVTLQVLLRENPLAQPGLSLGQRLMYLATLWSCVGGCGALAHLAAPVLFLGFGLRPITDYGPALLARLLPYLLASHGLAVACSARPRSWRGFADSAFWVRACGAAVANVAVGRPLDRVGAARPGRRVTWPRRTAVVLLAAAAAVGVGRYLSAPADGDPTALVVNLGWALADAVLLGAGRRAAGQAVGRSRRYT